MPTQTLTRPHPTLASSSEDHDFDPMAEIEFMDSDEFQDLDYSPSELKLIEELTAVTGDSGSNRRDTLFGALLGRSLPPLCADQEQVLFRRMNFVKFEASALQATLSSSRPSQRKTARIEELLHEADRIQRRIVESNLRLVVSIARKYTNPHHELLEFVSDGLMILLGAIRKFDYSRGFRFSTYATHAVQRHYFRVIRKTQKHQQRFMPTPGDVLENVIEHEEAAELAPDPEAIYRQLMQSAQGQLSEREEVILHRRFGTDGESSGKPLREVARELGISKERVRQIQIAALAKLRAVAADCNLLPTPG